MKKFLPGLLILSLLFSACASKAPEQSQQQPSAPVSFEADFQWNDELAEQYLSQDSIPQIAFAGPFYFGNFEGMDGYTKNYFQARNKKVDEIMKVTDESIGYLNELNEKLKDERNIMDWYFLKIGTLAPDSREQLLQEIDKKNQYALMNTVKLAYLNSLQKQLAVEPKSAEWGFMAYTKYYLVYDLTENFIDEISFLNSRFVTLYALLDKDGDQVYRDTNKELDDSLNPVSEKINELIHKVSFNNGSLAHEEKILMSADIVYMKQFLAYAETELPKMKQALADYKGGNKYVTQEALDVMDEQVKLYEEFFPALKKYISTIPESDFVENFPYKIQQAWVPVARAGLYDAASWLGGKISSATSTAYDYGKAGVNVGWEATKTAVVVVKDATVATVKFGGKVIGTGLDVASANMKTNFDVINGIYYGNSFKDIKESIEGNYIQVKDNFEKGIQGHQVYEDAGKMLDEVDNTIAMPFENLASYAAGGEGKFSKSVAYGVKTISGFFTGFGKDVYTALNPNSSETDTLTSLFGIGLSCIGGSGSFLKGSDALKIMGGKMSGLWSSGSKMFNYMASIDKEAAKTTFKNFFKDGFKGAVKQVFSQEGKRLAADGMVTVAKETQNLLSSNLKNGYNMIMSNAKENIPNAFKGLFKSQGVSGVLKDLFNVADGTNLAQKSIGFLNSVIGSMMDDKIKNWTKQGLQYMGTSDKIAEELMTEEEQQELVTAKNEAIKELVQDYSKELQSLGGDLSSIALEGENSEVELVVPPIEPSDANQSETSVSGAKVVPGKYYGQLNMSSTAYGITSTGNGPVDFKINDDYTVKCYISITSKSSGSMNGVRVSGTGSGATDSCAGTIDPLSGNYSVSGSMTGNGIASVSGQGFSQTASGGNTLSFTATGNLNGNVLTGSGSMGGITFNVSPAEVQGQ